MLEVKNLTKKFGKFTALQDISLTVKDGSVYGLVGYNGAGKTTLLKNISGIYRPENGEVLFDGENIWDNEKKKEELFFMPDDLFFAPNTNMKKMAAFYNGYYKRFSYETFNRLVEAFGLDPKKRINGFSKGNVKDLRATATYFLADIFPPGFSLTNRAFRATIIKNYERRRI